VRGRTATRNSKALPVLFRWNTSSSVTSHWPQPEAHHRRCTLSPRHHAADLVRTRARASLVAWLEPSHAGRAVQRPSRSWHARFNDFLLVFLALGRRLRAAFSKPLARQLGLSPLLLKLCRLPVPAVARRRRYFCARFKRSRGSFKRRAIRRAFAHCRTGDQQAIGRSQRLDVELDRRVSARLL